MGVPTDLVVSPQQCEEAYQSLSNKEKTTLQNMYARIKSFAELQRSSVQDTEMNIPGGKAGHTVSPCQAAGCYAPGGRYPLPSSVLMTAVTARAAGCPTVVLCSPKPAPITLAAAHIAGADVFLQIGGAQAIATMAYGLTMATTTEKDEEGSETTTKTITVPPCDVICGPGNQWVTAAKSIVQGKCGIDMLAGPSEVLVICDDTAIPAVVAADLIAQAEHDVVARAILLCTCPKTIHVTEFGVDDSGDGTDGRVSDGGLVQSKTGPDYIGGGAYCRRRCLFTNWWRPSDRDHGVRVDDGHDDRKGRRRIGDDDEDDYGPTV